MKQTASVISTYASNTSGVCSALYELGGMTIMHDPSGCNSTYGTHDEPRWYDIDSMIYVSGLSEMEAIMGDDNKLIDDIVYSAKELSPKFIAIAGGPVPIMIGTDFEAIAEIVERETNIPTMGFDTDGMQSYVLGVKEALEGFARKFVNKDVKEKIARGINILGATPLDFSINGTVESIRELLKENNFEVISSWAMGSTLEDIKKASSASVNLVISYSGLGVAKYLYEEFKIPYVIGTPYGEVLSKKIIDDLNKVIISGENIISYKDREIKKDADITIIGETVMSESLAYAISKEKNKSVEVISALETEKEILLEGDTLAMDEDDIISCIKNAKIIIADPLYKPICPKNTKFISLPHEGFSGRIYRQDIPNLIGKLK